MIITVAAVTTTTTATGTTTQANDSGSRSSNGTSRIGWLLFLLLVGQLLFHKWFHLFFLLA